MPRKQKKPNPPKKYPQVPAQAITYLTYLVSKSSGSIFGLVEKIDNQHFKIRKLVINPRQQTITPQYTITLNLNRSQVQYARTQNITQAITIQAEIRKHKFPQAWKSHTTTKQNLNS